MIPNKHITSSATPIEFKLMDGTEVIGTAVAKFLGPVYTGHKDDEHEEHDEHKKGDKMSDKERSKFQKYLDGNLWPMIVVSILAGTVAMNMVVVTMAAQIRLNS